MKKISVIGVGYVGLVTAACFSDLGNHVTALDVNEERVAGLKRGEMPIYEPGLEELVNRNVQAGRLHFTTSYPEALKESEFIFICVGTPSGGDGEADLKYVESAARSIAEHMQAPAVVVNKSTVPVGTGDFVADIIRKAQPKPVDFWVVSCPEFLREGAAITDFMNPHRTVLGSLHREAADKVAQLHLPLRAPIVITDLRTAEMIKYASNAFLATKISFINEIADVCESLGADVKEVAAGMGFDTRIGKQFLEAGLGYGGSCFPKDVKALAYMAEEMGHEPRILNSVMEVNGRRRELAVRRLEQALGGLQGRRIGLLGLAFKANTDDMREAPSIDIAEALLAAGAQVRAFDPVAMPAAAELLPKVEMAQDAYDLAEGCDAILVVTEWNEFKNLDMGRVRESMKTPVIVDGRNLYQPQVMRNMGFDYYGIGRGYNENGIIETEIEVRPHAA
ncbi:MAG: UDP-glucose/GDP-mannose dehydrogenase family protein [Anaerolineales bacterium]|nr:UDP-glucose/GDP-mannose dehydrogenase family protein [Anaerolineales bacterium]